jgi:hypothetical protein
VKFGKLVIANQSGTKGAFSDKVSDTVFMIEVDIWVRKDLSKVQLHWPETSICNLHWLWRLLNFSGIWA